MTNCSVCRLVLSFCLGCLGWEVLTHRALAQDKPHRKLELLEERSKRNREPLANSPCTFWVMDGVAASGNDAQAVGDHLKSSALAAEPYSRAPRDYAAYLLLTNQLDKTVAELRAMGDRNDQSTVALLARLLQVQGQLDEALTLAKTTDLVPLKADLFYRAEDWAALAQPDLVPGDRGLERFGFEATFHRLAGHPSEFEAAVAGLIEEVLESFPNSARHHHDLAWLLARCERARAIELGQRNLATQLANQHSQGQLRRFKEPSSPDVGLSGRVLRCVGPGLARRARCR